MLTNTKLYGWKKFKVAMSGMELQRDTVAHVGPLL